MPRRGKPSAVSGGEPAPWPAEVFSNLFQTLGHLFASAAENRRIDHHHVVINHLIPEAVRGIPQTSYGGSDKAPFWLSGSILTILSRDIAIGVTGSDSGPSKRNLSGSLRIYGQPADVGPGILQHSVAVAPDSVFLRLTELHVI
jgi:hypothetical protein